MVMGRISGYRPMKASAVSPAMLIPRCSLALGNFGVVDGRRSARAQRVSADDQLSSDGGIPERSRVRSSVRKDLGGI